MIAKHQFNIRFLHCRAKRAGCHLDFDRKKIIAKPSSSGSCWTINLFYFFGKGISRDLPADFISAFGISPNENEEAESKLKS